MAELIGEVFMRIGGVLLVFIVLVLMAKLAAEVWIGASNRWRDICKAESLIHEYRRNRKDYMKWKELQANTEKDGD